MAGIVTYDGLHWDDVERGLNKVVWTTTTTVFDWAKRLWGPLRGIKTWEWRGRSLAGLPLAGPWLGEGDEVQVSGGNSRFRLTAHMGYCGNRIAYTYKRKKHDPYDLLKGLAAGLKPSILNLRNKYAIAKLCGGFSGTWGTDPKITEPQFSDVHTYDPRYVGGGVYWSNIISGAMSQSTIGDGINLLINQRDDLGNPLNLNPDLLICATTKAMDARQALGFPGRAAKSPDSANDLPNRLGEYDITVLPCPLIDDFDSNMWFVADSSQMRQYLNWNDNPAFESWMNDTNNKTTLQRPFPASWRG